MTTHSFKIQELTATDKAAFIEIKRLRQTYFFDKASIQDPYTWTFDHPEHKHFILSLDSLIIGYAHIQLWPQARAILRIIVIEEPYQGQGYGHQLLRYCETWLAQNGYQTLYTDSRATSLPFYIAEDYQPMAFEDPEGHESHPDDISMGKILK